MKQLFAICLSLLALSAQAAFPDKPIRVVIGFPAGGPLDQHARLLIDRLQTQLGQPYKRGHTDL
jgi:tripartite-type tricarboxylate transporter receptor subunit TctC